MTPETGAQNIHDGRRVVHVRAQHFQMFLGGFHGHSGFDIRVLGHFEILLRDGARSYSTFARSSCVSPAFIGYRVPVIRSAERCRRFVPS